ncbi:MAG: hypothetical protein JXR15_06410 [Shimia sp.]|uniref:hypothetical protein n=1 Tax=Shimia sp. TaxID=1954381 RepID=UPI003B8CB491
MSELEDAITWLKQAPMQRMSLGSRELFHSDFLYWLFTQYPSALSAVFDLPEKVYEITREEQNLDLVVRARGEPTPVLIVENKVKSCPDQQQLERYNTKFPDTRRRVLLTLVAPAFDPNAFATSWKTLLYRELAKKLGKWAKLAKVAQEHVQYIADYVSMICHLSSVAESCFSHKKIKDADYWFSSSNEETLETIGFAQTLQKYQAAVFLDDMRTRVSEKIRSEFSVPLIKDGGKEAGGDHVKAWSALFNNTPCVTFEPCLAQPEKAGMRFEIQVQGTQYRRLIAGPPLQPIFAKKMDRAEKVQLTWETLDKRGGGEWLFGRRVERDAQNAKGFYVDETWVSSKMRGEMCFYRPDVVYQYVDIGMDEAKTGLSVAQLSDRIARDIELAFKLLRNQQDNKN